MMTESIDPGAAAARATSAGSTLKERSDSGGMGRVSVAAIVTATTATNILERTRAAGRTTGLAMGTLIVPVMLFMLLAASFRCKPDFLGQCRRNRSTAHPANGNLSAPGHVTFYSDLGRSAS